MCLPGGKPHLGVAGRALILALVATLLLNLAPPGASGATAAPYTLDLTTGGGGGVAAAPAGPTYDAGTVVTLTPAPAAGNVLIGWTVDGVARGWGAPLTITMDADHAVVAIFAARGTFSDLPTGDPYAEAVGQLAARGIVKGYGDGTFGPGDPLLRAQMAALIARAMGWQGEDPASTTFTDLDGVDGELQRAIRTLASYGVIRGYGGGLFGPFDEVLHVQVISFVARAMVSGGYWVAATTDDPALYPNVPPSSGHRLDLATYARNAGAFPDRAPGQDWPAWDTPAPRGWVAAVLWRALDRYFGAAGANPSPGGSPGATPSPSPGADPPLALADSYSLAEDTALRVAAPGPLGNDSDPAGGPLTAIKVTDPAHGTLVLGADGAFTYTPMADYAGPDSFTYRARGAGDARSAVTTVALTVTPVNDPPVHGVPGAQQVTANGTLIFSAATGNAITVADVDAGTGPLRVTLTATNGTLTLGGTAGLDFADGDGTADPTIVFSGDLAAINAALDRLGFAPTGGYTGPATLEIATDDRGNTGAGGPLGDRASVAIGVLAGAARAIAKESGDGGSATVGSARTLRVKVTDGTGVPVPGYTVTWAAASGSLSAPTSVTDASGIAAIDWTLGTAAGMQTATATATGLTGSPLTFGVAATPAAAATATSTIVADPASLVADGAATATITVRLRDQYGNALSASGGTVILATSGGALTTGGAPSASLTATDNLDGTYSATLIAPTLAGTATIGGTLNGVALADGAAITFTAGAATNIAAQAGDGQTATVGTAVAVAPAALVTDQFGNPVPGATVTFAVASGGGGVTGATATTDSAGIATAGGWTLGTVAGANTLTATTGAFAPTTFSATATADLASRLAVAIQPAATAQSGVAFPQQPAVQLRDQHGNAVAQAGVVVTVELDSGDGTLGGTLTANTAANGLATFTDLAITGAIGVRTLTFAAPGLAPTTSDPITLTAGSAAHLAIVTEPAASARSGIAFTRQPVVQLQDASGNPIVQSGIDVTAALDSGGGTLGGTVTVSTDSAGFATFTDLAISGLVGERTLRFSTAGLTGATSEPIALAAGAAVQLAIATAPSSAAQAGLALGQQPIVQLQDGGGNPVAQAGIDVTVALASGSGALLGTATVATDANGTATFADLAIGGLAGDYGLSFSATGVAPAQSGTITLAAGTAAALAFTTQPTGVAAGAAITPAVAVAIRDAYGNTVTGATGSVTVALASNPAGGTLGGTTSAAAVGGVATFGALTIDRVGTGYTLAAGAGALTGATSDPFSVAPGPLDHFTIEASTGGDIGPQTSGSPFAITITARDAFDNTVTAFTGTVDLTSNGTLAAGGGTTAAFAGGVLASHSLTLGAGGGGVTITATHTGGTASGTSNAFAVQAPPQAVDDGPANGTTAPGAAFHGFYNQSFAVNGAAGLLANDTLGSPSATLVSFKVGTTTYTTLGVAQGVAGGHSLTVGADGGLTFAPATGFTGIFSFQYTISNGTHSSTAAATIAIGSRPTATSATYGGGNLVRNVTLDTTGTAEKITFAGDNATFAVTGGSNGTGTINADGTYRFVPNPAAAAGAASFTFTVTNGFGTSTAATLGFTLDASRIWFVDKGVGTSGNGTQASPWKDLDNVAGTAANDAIYLAENGTPYAAGITLQNGQKLIGQDIGSGTLAAAAGVTLAAHQALPSPNGANGTRATITPAGGGTTITLGSGNTLRGLTLGNSATAIAGTNFGTLTVSDLTIGTTGRALNLSTGTLAGSGFLGITSSGGANNIALTGVQSSGTFALGAGALSGASGEALKIDGQNGSFSYAGTIANTSTLAVNIANKTGGTVTLTGDINPANAARGIAVAGNSGGTITFGGASVRIAATGATGGVSLSGNTGATIAFTGGGLSIETATGNGFSATGGGTVAVTGAGNAISSAGGIALNVTSTTIGESGLTFHRIDTYGGSNGIVLSGTGTDGGLTVTGDGGNCGIYAFECTGGAIQNTVGADGTTAGIGIYLSDTRNVSLTGMQLNDHPNYAIRGSNVANIALIKMRISGTNGTSGAHDEGSVRFTGLTGTAAVTDSLIEGGYEDNVAVLNSSGTLDRITFDGNTFGQNVAGNSSNDALFIQARGTAVLKATLNNNDFTGAGGDIFQFDLGDSASADLQITGNRFDNTHPNTAAGGGGLTITTQQAGVLTYTITGNTLRGAKGTALAVGKIFGQPSTATADGRIENNTIGVTGVANSGSSEGSGIEVSAGGGGAHTTLIKGNQIRRYTNYGIHVIAGGSSQAATGETHDAALNATIQANTIAEPNALPGGFPQNGLHLNAGTNSSGGEDAYQICLDIGSASLPALRNTLHGSGASDGTDFRLRQRFSTTVRLPGYTGTSTDVAGVVSYVQGRNNNPGSTTGGAVTGNGGGFQGTAGGAACAQPPAAGGAIVANHTAPGGSTGSPCPGIGATSPASRCLPPGTAPGGPRTPAPGIAAARPGGPRRSRRGKTVAPR